MCCVSERRAAADRMCTDARCNDLCVKADRGHILIFHNPLSSHRTPLMSCEVMSCHVKSRVVYFKSELSLNLVKHELFADGLYEQLKLQIL